jgi:catechol 2,3-dioxygenase-like lactoylglutathione lyase family enzyme
MRLYMAELAVRDLAASLHFYRDRLGLPVELLDEANGFALLHAGGRLALKHGTPGGGVTVHLEVADLGAEVTRLGESADIKASPEGYRRAVLRDPDGYRVVLFEWSARGS